MFDFERRVEKSRLSWCGSCAEGKVASPICSPLPPLVLMCQEAPADSGSAGCAAHRPWYPSAMLEFVVPATPVLRALPPRGPDWLHEAKFDGWRVQVHMVTAVREGAYHCTRRFPWACRSTNDFAGAFCILDEVTACDVQGLPDYARTPV